nr:hypothetical protein CFP56_25995 [Quercus suber]
MISICDRLHDAFEQLRASDSPLVFRGCAATGRSVGETDAGGLAGARTIRNATVQQEAQGVQAARPQQSYLDPTAHQYHEEDLTNGFQANGPDILPSSWSIHSMEHNPFDYAFGIAAGDALPYYVVYDPLLGEEIVYCLRQISSRRDSSSSTDRVDSGRRSYPSVADWNTLANKLVWDTIHDKEISDTIFRHCWLQRCLVMSVTPGPYACRLSHCDVSDSTLRGCELWRGSVTSCDIANSLLIDVTITNGKLQHCDLDHCELVGNVEIGYGVNVRSCIRVLEGERTPIVIGHDGVMR